MTRVLEILPFYSLDEAMEYLNDGGEQLPLHHVWCYDQIFNNGYEVKFIANKKNSFLNRVGRLIDIDNLYQQVKVIRKSKEYDLVFDPFMQFTFLLALLKLLGLYRKPIVALAHRAYMVNKREPLKRARQYLIRYIYFKAIDKILFVNHKVAEESAKYAIKGNTGSLESWGIE